MPSFLATQRVSVNPRLRFQAAHFEIETVTVEMSARWSSIYVRRGEFAAAHAKVVRQTPKKYPETMTNNGERVKMEDVEKVAYS